MLFGVFLMFHLFLLIRGTLDIPSGVPEATLDFSKIYSQAADPICCLAASDKLLLVARESGTLHRYTIPHLTLQRKYVRATRRNQRLQFL